MNDRYYINIIIRKIEKKLNWKKVSLWTDNEFKKLSSLIFENTAISISPQTLKRLFGKVKYKDVYSAQPATKDALARFLNYANWDMFIQDQAHSYTKYPSIFKEGAGSFFRNNRLALSIFSFAIVIISLVILVNSRSTPISFFADNLTGITPHTVSLHYDISNFKNKDVYIDFDLKEAEDRSQGELLDKHRTLINHCYESPGYFNVTISSQGKKIGSAKIHALSEGWWSYYFNDDNFSLRKFVFGLEKRVRDVEIDSLLYISPKELNNQGFNGNTVYYLEHMLYKDFHVSADSCSLEVRYRNSSDMGGISCYDTEFRIIGEKGMASVMLVQHGCYRWSEIIVGEKHLNGKYNDLSFLSTDLSSWNVLKIELENNKAIIVNGADSIFTCQYNQQIGQIKGIRFVTKGSGAFDYVRLYNKQGQILYNENFEN